MDRLLSMWWCQQKMHPYYVAQTQEASALRDPGGYDELFYSVCL
jgi:hypothetical protein